MPDIADLFSQARYTTVAMSQDATDWRVSASRRILQCPDGDLLKGDDGAGQNEEKRFYEAAGFWVAGDEARAKEILSSLTTPAAHRLLHLISKPKIRVLSQWFSTGHPPHLLHSGIAHDSKFEVTNLGFGTGDRRYDLNAPVEALVDPLALPDFFVTMMAEWHIIPPGIYDLPCPIFAHSGDLDLHLHSELSKLSGFDEVIVSDDTEWVEWAPLLPGPVSTFPKMVGLTKRQLPPIPSENQVRDIDILMTGTVLHPYHPDKAALFHKVLESRARRPLFVNGFLSGDRYFEMLGRARLVLCHIRHPGAISSRAMDALAMGCPALVPHDSVLRLFLGEEDGLVAYDLAEGPTEAINAVLARPELWQERGRRGAEKIRMLFDEKRIASHYLRYLTVRAAVVETSPYRAKAKIDRRKRPILAKGRLSCSPQDTIRWTLGQVAAWEGEDDARTLNDAGRELLIIHAAATRGLGDPMAAEGALERAARKLIAACHADAEALVPRVNLLRLLVHFGLDAELRQAAELADEIVAADISRWHVDPMDDPLPYDFFGDHFDYRSHIDGCTSLLGGGSGDLVKGLLAQVWYLLGRLGQGEMAFARAVALNPAFPTYRLWQAKALLRKGDGDSVRAALGLLEGLAEGSHLTAEAVDLLMKVGAAVGLDTAPIERLGERFFDSFLNLEDDGVKFNTPWHGAQLMIQTPTGGGQMIRGRRATADEPEASLIVVSVPGRNIIPALRATPPDPTVEVLVADPFDLMAPDAPAHASSVICANQQALLHHGGAAANIALEQARGHTVAICGGGDILPAGLLEGLLYGDDEIVLLDTGIEPPSSVGEALDRIFAGRLGGAAVIAPLDAVRAVKGFDEHGLLAGRLGGVWELARRLIGNGAPWRWGDGDVRSGQSAAALQWVPPIADAYQGVPHGGWAELEEVVGQMLVAAKGGAMKPSSRF